MSDETPGTPATPPPAKKTAAKRTPAKKTAAKRRGHRRQPVEGELVVVMVGRSRGAEHGDQRTVTAEKAASLVERGLATYADPESE